MKKLMLTLIAALTITAAAQTPQQTATAIFDRVYAAPIDCLQVNELAVFAEEVEYAYCGYIGDKFTNVNKRWTEEEYVEQGYVTLADWEVEQWGLTEMHLLGVANSRYLSVATLITTADAEGTAMLIVFDRR